MEAAAGTTLAMVILAIRTAVDSMEEDSSKAADAFLTIQDNLIGLGGLLEANGVSIDDAKKVAMAAGGELRPPDWMSKGIDRDPQRGDIVEVFKGRKVPKGTVGEVFWAGEGRWGLRVGIREEGREEPWWTAASNCRVVEGQGATKAARRKVA
jgi:hypothetical protein